MIKLIACDLDNTLLNAEHELSEEDSAVIEEIIDAGIPFMVATGRSYEAAKNLVEQFHIHCDYIVLNGAVIQSQKHGVILELPLANEILRKLVQLLEEEDMCYHMYTKQGTVTLDAKRFHDEMIGHLMRIGLDENVVKTMIKKGKFGVFDMEITDIQAYVDTQPSVYKVELFATDANRQQQLVQRLHQIEGLEITNSVADNIEITSDKAQKGTTLLNYCEQNKIQKDEVLVFGDSLNDLNMITSFPNSFAVENAIAPIKEAATFITKSNIEHGVTSVLKHLLKNPKDMEFLNNFKKNPI